MIIGIAGKKGSGKNTAATFFTENDEFKELSFSHPLKKACAYALREPFAVFHDQNLKELPFKSFKSIDFKQVERIIEYLSRYHYFTPNEVVAVCERGVGTPTATPRQYMQFVGTELIRAKVDPQFWCKALHKDIVLYPNVVIPDARFPNEREFLRTLGAEILLIERPGLASSDTHASENLLGEPSEYNAVFQNDSTIEHLWSELSSWYGQKERSQRSRVSTGLSAGTEERESAPQETTWPEQQTRKAV